MHEEGGAGKHRRRLQGTRNGLDYSEILSTVCKYFCDGHPPAKIAELMAEKHGITDMKREEPYHILSRAAALRRLQFVAPSEYVLKDKIRDKCPWLQDVDVVHTAVSTPVGGHVASMLLRLLQRHALAGKEVVHIGLAGGHAMRKVCRSFVHLLREAPAGLPRRIVLHAMAAGFDVEDPTTAPTTFSAYFVEDPAILQEIRFVGFYAPTLVEKGEFDRMKSHEGMEEGFARVAELDVIVTSASLWSDEHSLLSRYLAVKSASTLDALREKGCIGDLLWRPLSKSGPVDIEEEKVRAMTLMELHQFPAFIQGGKQVLLVLGPCSECHTPKTDILEAILTMQPYLITHLVTDSVAAREVVKRLC